MDAGEYLKEATRLKRAKDLKGAVEAIDRALDGTSFRGPWRRPDIFNKRISYLLLDGRTEEALATANRMIEEAPEQSLGDQEMVGVWFCFGYSARSRVLSSLKRFRAAFEDDLRAAWHWYQAMKLQKRTEEHTPERAAEGLLEKWEEWSIEEDDVLSLTEQGLRAKDAESMVRRFKDLELKEPTQE